MMNVSVAHLFRRIIDAWLDVLYPPRCFGCGVSIPAIDVLCPRCVASLLPLPVDMARSDAHLSSLTFPADARMLIVGFEHEPGGILEACIHAMKYNRLHRVGVWLGRMLGEVLYDSPILENNPVLVPVPLHRIKRLERGYNQAEHLCRGLSAECGLEHYPRLLKRVRYTLSQSASRLDRERRRSNMIDAFTVVAHEAECCRGRPIVLVDDLITTGSTMGECAALLIDHGFMDIRLLALARPPGHSPQAESQCT